MREQINPNNVNNITNIKLSNLDWRKLSRKNRGYLIAKRFVIKKTPRGWRVPSQSVNGNCYVVNFNGHEPKCTCLDCQLNRKKCKHIYAVEFYLQKEIANDGKTTITKGIKITYPQFWKAYNFAQTNEKIIFMKLLNDLCKNIEQPEYNFGRPNLPRSDLVFSSVMKVYTTFSLRRFMSDIRIAKEKGYVDVVSSYPTISNFMRNEEVTKILKELIKISSLPLKNVETDFAVDSSGFATSRFARWFDTKWGKAKQKRIWLKAHLISGVKTNIITSCEITEGHSADSNELSKLVKDTSKNFEMKEVSCDKAYSGRVNFNAIEEVGAIPFIPFKKGSSSKSKGSLIWNKMFHYFLYKHEEFMQHYHKRSNSETCFHMIKTKFGASLRSKSKTAQINELLCKILCNNICVVIQEMSELGIKGEFIVEKSYEESF